MTKAMIFRKCIHSTKYIDSVIEHSAENLKIYDSSLRSMNNKKLAHISLHRSVWIYRIMNENKEYQIVQWTIITIPNIDTEMAQLPMIYCKGWWGTETANEGSSLELEIKPTDDASTKKRTSL